MGQVGLTLAGMRAAREGLADLRAREVVALCGTRDQTGHRDLAILQLAIQAFDEVIVSREVDWPA